MTDHLARDRVLTCVIAGLGRLDDPRLVLTGGTLLRICGFEHYRFSEDLDFDWLGSRRSFAKAVRRAWPAIRSLARSHNPTADISQHSVRISHDGADGRHNNDLKVDCNVHPLLRRRIYSRPNCMWTVRDRYGDLGAPTLIRGLTLESVAASKIGCLSARRAARDLYDLYRLMESDAVDMDAAWSLYLDLWKLYRVDKRLGPGRRLARRWKPDPHPAYLKEHVMGGRRALAGLWAATMLELLAGDQRPGGPPGFDHCYEMVSEWISHKHERYLNEYTGDSDPFTDAARYQKRVRKTARRRAAYHRHRLTAPG